MVQHALADIYYVSNTASGNSTAVELEGGTLALSGNYFSVHLVSNGSISQTAMVPDDAGSLQFEATSPRIGHVYHPGRTKPFLFGPF